MLYKVLGGLSVYSLNSSFPPSPLLNCTRLGWWFVKEPGIIIENQYTTPAQKVDRFSKM